MKNKFWSAGWWQQTIAPDVAAVLQTLIKSVAWLTVAFGLWTLTDRYILTARDGETLDLLRGAQADSQKLSSQVLVAEGRIHDLEEQLSSRIDSLDDFADAIKLLEGKIDNIDQTLSWEGYSIEWGIIKSVQPETSRVTRRKTSHMFSAKFVEPPIVLVSLKQGKEKKGVRGGSRVTPGNGKLPIRGYYNCLIKRITQEKFSFHLKQISREPSSYHIDMHWIAIGPVKH